MTVSPQLVARFSARVWLALMVGSSFLGVSSVKAEDIKVQLTLIWATSDEKEKKDAEKTYKEIAPELAKEFQEPFKWKYYFEIGKTNGLVASRGSKVFKMSEKCEVKVTELPGPDVTVELFGQGKPVNKTTKSLQPGELVTIGQSDKGGSAWFVVVHRPKERPKG